MPGSYTSKGRMILDPVIRLSSEILLIGAVVELMSIASLLPSGESIACDVCSYEMAVRSCAGIFKRVDDSRMPATRYNNQAAIRIDR